MKAAPFMRHTKQSDYMNWAKTSSQATFNLATSGMANLSIKDLRLDFDDLEQLLPGIGEVLAQMVLERDAGPRHLGLEEIRHYRQTAAAAGAGLRARLDLGHRLEALLADGHADRRLADVVARADLGIVAHAGGAPQCRGRGPVDAHQFAGRTRQRAAALGQHGERPVVGRIADQDAA